jgi:hypothetical protein
MSVCAHQVVRARPCWLEHADATSQGDLPDMMRDHADDRAGDLVRPGAVALVNLALAASFASKDNGQDASRVTGQVPRQVAGKRRVAGTGGVAGAEVGGRIGGRVCGQGQGGERLSFTWDKWDLGPALGPSSAAAAVQSCTLSDAKDNDQGAAQCKAPSKLPRLGGQGGASEFQSSGTAGGMGGAMYMHDVHHGWVSAAAVLQDACTCANGVFAAGHARGVLVEWMWTLSYRARMSADAVALAVQFLDRYMHLDLDVRRSTFQLLGSTCALVAAKVEDVSSPCMRAFTKWSGGVVKPADLTASEPRVCRALHHHLLLPTATKFAAYYAHRIAPDDGALHNAAMAACHATIASDTWASAHPQHAAVGAVAWAVANCTLFRSCQSWEESRRIQGAPHDRTKTQGQGMSQGTGEGMSQGTGQGNGQGMSQGTCAEVVYERLGALQIVSGIAVDHTCVARVYGAVDASLAVDATEAGTFAHRFRALTGTRDVGPLLRQFDAQLATCALAAK